jgi:uncharacterized membrane protein (DUF4010 family)
MLPVILMRRQTKNYTSLYLSFIILLLSIGLVLFFPVKSNNALSITNLRVFPFILFALTIIQAINYFSIKKLGSKLGPIVAGFLGGMISSTSVFVNLCASSSKQETPISYIIIIALWSLLGVMVEIFFLIALFSSHLAEQMMLPFGLMIIVGICLTLLIHYYMNENQKSKLPELAFMDLEQLFNSAVAIFALLTIQLQIKQLVSTQSLYFLSFIAGSFEVIANTYSTVIIYLTQRINAQQATALVGIIILANFLTKIIMLLLLARNRFGLITSIGIILMLIFGGAGCLVMSHFN